MIYAFYLGNPFLRNPLWSSVYAPSIYASSIKSAHQPTHDTDDHHSAYVKNAPPDDYMTRMTRPVWVDMSGATRRKCFDLVQRCAFLSHDQSQHRCLADLGGVVEHGTHLNLDGGFKYIFHAHPYLGKISNLTTIFQMGWNHQLATLFFAQMAEDPKFFPKRMRKTIATNIKKRDPYLGLWNNPYITL